MRCVADKIALTALFRVYGLLFAWSTCGASPQTLPYSKLLSTMANRSFDAELAQLESLREQPRESTEAPLRKALSNRNSFLVAKAARLAADHEHRSLIPDLAAAFPRFSDAKTDPQCWAREAIAKALAAFDYQDSAIFLAGMNTFQPGFADDTATALRGICALALVNCRDLSSHRVLTLLLPLFADKQLPVRVNAARAVEQIGSDAAALLLRFRAELASDEPELLGACYSGVLRLEGSSRDSLGGKISEPIRSR